MNEIHPQYVVDGEGRRRGELLELSEFEELLECLQDVLDAKEIERLKGEPRLSWAEVKGEREAGPGA